MFLISHLTTSRPTFLIYKMELDHPLSSLPGNGGVYESSEIICNILYVHMCIFPCKEVTETKKVRTLRLDSH